MKTLKKTPVAILVMLVVIALSSIFGCYRSLLELKDAAEAYFDVSSNVDLAGGSIQRELETICAVTINFKTIASRYLDVSDSRLTTLTLARQSLSEAVGVGEKYIAAMRLREAVDAVNESLEGYKMNSTDKGFRDSLYDDIQAAYARIERSSYNDAASEFNMALTSFPGYYLVGWMSIPTLESFGDMPSVGAVSEETTYFAND